MLKAIVGWNIEVTDVTFTSDTNLPLVSSPQSKWSITIVDLGLFSLVFVWWQRLAHLNTRSSADADKTARRV